MPKVSVIIPIFNEEKVIRKCLISLLKQNLKDFEIIAVDDGSNDKTMAVLSGIRDIKCKIRVLQQNHLGAGAARNFGASRAKGEILVFVDADMSFEEDFLKALIAPIVAGQAKGANSHDEEVGNWENVWARCWNYNENRGKKMQKTMAGNDPVFRAILKSEFEKVGGFEEGGYTDDYSLSRKLGYLAAVTKAKFYHDNPDCWREVFLQSRWVGKREYKLGWFGVIGALLRVSLPITKLMGVYKAIEYRTPTFFLFKIVYNTGVTLGIFDYYLFGKKTK